MTDHGGDPSRDSGDGVAIPWVPRPALIEEAPGRGHRAPALTRVAWRGPGLRPSLTRGSTRTTSRLRDPSRVARSSALGRRRGHAAFRRPGVCRCPRCRASRSRTRRGCHARACDRSGRRLAELAKLICPARARGGATSGCRPSRGGSCRVDLGRCPRCGVVGGRHEPERRRGGGRRCRGGERCHRRRSVPIG